jgi:steroid delta-isomerase-like uncharacterized protein
MSTAKELKVFIQTYTDAVWNQHNPDAIDRYFTPDYVHHDVSSPAVKTREDYKQWARALQSGLSDLHVSIDDIIAEEDKVVKRWTASGVHSSTFLSIPATNKRVTFSGATAYQVIGDQVVESWYVYDTFGLLQQLGSK